MKLIVTAQMINLAHINSLNKDQVREALFKCSGSSVWTDSMMMRWPYASGEDLIKCSEAAWSKLSDKDWLQAFAHHPKIGDLESLRQKFASTATWASGEQTSVTNASEETLRRLAEGNERYEEKFGYIFIVCATGKTAPEMLSILEERLPNQAGAEFEIACNEQKKITQLRMEKLQP